MNSETNPTRRGKAGTPGKKVFTHFIELRLVLVFLAVFSPAVLAQDNGANGPVELIFPIVHSEYLDGAVNFQTTFSFLNLSASSVNATLVAYQDSGKAKRILGLCPPSGEPPDLQEVETRFEIPAGGGRAFLTQADLFGDLPGFAGWAKVTLDREVEIRGSSEVLLRTSPEPCIVLSGKGTSAAQHGLSHLENLFLRAVQVSAVKPSRIFRSRALHNVFRRSAFSIVNPSGINATVTVEISSPHTGEITASSELQVPAQQRISRFVNEMVQFKPCPECSPFTPEGLIRFSSNVPIAVGGILVLGPDRHWVSLPVEPIDFQ